jgi:hypothetical protein
MPFSLVANNLYLDRTCDPHLGMLVLHVLELYVPPPARLPDLYAALFSIFGAANLCYAYLVGVRKMFAAGEEQWLHTMDCEDSDGPVSEREVKVPAATKRTRRTKAE